MSGGDFTDVSERRECGWGNLFSARSIRLHKRVDGTGRGVERIQGGDGVYRGAEDHCKKGMSKLQ